LEVVTWLPWVLIGVAALAVLIFVHEAGHFVVGKLFGLKIHEFMFGLPGPKLLSFKRGDTEYGVTVIPFGGYVKVAGSDPFEELPAEDVPRSFPAQPFWKKTLIIAAGPVTNLAFALLLFSSTFALSGVPTPTTTVFGVLAGTPAQEAGLVRGDTIVRAGGVSVDTWDDLVREIRAKGGKELELVVARGIGWVTLTPTLETTRGHGFLGIEPVSENRPASAGQIARGAWQTQWGLARLIVEGFYPQTFVKNIPEFRGPVGIAEEGAKAARRGAPDFLFFTAVISVALGVFNLLPLPPLDGGRVAISAVEAIRRKKLAQKTELAFTAVGASLLVTLMVYLVYSDVARLIVGAIR
jgi:regulator of sigma E protease